MASRVPLLQALGEGKVLSWQTRLLILWLPTWQNGRSSGNRWWLRGSKSRRPANPQPPPAVAVADRWLAVQAFVQHAGWIAKPPLPTWTPAHAGWRAGRS